MCEWSGESDINCFNLILKILLLLCLIWESSVSPTCSMWLTFHFWVRLKDHPSSIISFLWLFLLASSGLYSSFTDSVLTVSMQGLHTLSPLACLFFGGEGVRKSLREWFFRSLLGKRGRKPFSALQSIHYQRFLNKTDILFPFGSLWSSPLWLRSLQDGGLKWFVSTNFNHWKLDLILGISTSHFVD